MKGIAGKGEVFVYCRIYSHPAKGYHQPNDRIEEGYNKAVCGSLPTVSL